MEKRKLRILFIGNSHTYYNDMPLMVRRRFVEEDGYDCEVTDSEEQVQEAQDEDTTADGDE